MKKFLCVLAAAMCSATLMLSACGGSSGGDSSVLNDGNTDYTDVTDGDEENTEVADDDNLIEVTATEAYEAFSAIKTKFQTNSQSDSFNMTFEGGLIESVKVAEEDGVRTLNTLLNIEAQCLYDGEHFYGDHNENYVEDAEIINEDTGIGYDYLMYRDTQSCYWEGWYSQEDFKNVSTKVATYDSMAEAINEYFAYDRNYEYFFEFFFVLLEADYYSDYDYGFEYDTTLKMYSENDYINIYISGTFISSEYEIYHALNLKINLAAGLVADDFEPLS